MKFSGRFVSRLFAPLLLLGFSFSAFAHNSSKGLSAISFKPVPQGIESRLAIAFADTDILYRLDKNSDESITGDEIAVTLKEMNDFPLKEIQVSLEGFTVEPTDIKATMQESNFEIHWLYTNSAAGTLRLRSSVLKRLTPDHQQFATILDGTNNVVFEQILTPEQMQFEYNFTPKTDSAAAPVVASSANSSWNKFTSFMIKGVDHILFDREAPLKITDHLLFLLALLVVCNSFRDVVKVITSFTVAHSLTLALVTLKLIPAPSKIIEPLIAATIVYVGLENLLKLKTLKWRWIITFLFGLIHGCGFAGSLQEMIGPGAVLLPLFSFNVGVEVGQVLVAAIAMPLFWQLKQVPQLGPRWAPICSTFVVAVGGWWFIQRVWL